MKLEYAMVIAILVGMLAGCNLAASPATPTNIPNSAPTLAFNQPSPTPLVILSTIPPASTVVVIPPTPATTDQLIFEQATMVVTALKDEDTAALASYIDPQKGLRFSPYAAVKDTDQIFTPDKVAGLFSDSTVYTWGGYFATGEPIQLTFADYYAKFIYDVDFANAPQVALNHRLGVSTTLDNSAEFYSGAMIVEYYFPGFDPNMEGMDWRSLRLVFMQSGNTWYLVGIIHDQWTT
ncbi:MAG TPA: hypothetical protein VLD65_06265 [Anaerolineales bacterium]|nr:hypothetical protein [Anaerolineales bacterium]